MASDRSRFYLEQSVPELQELIRKDLFTQPQVHSIVQTRSEYEHKINARGCSSADFARYAEYEMNLASLIKKRAKRRGIKNPLGYHGQRKVFFVLDRGVRRFPGDLRLWMQYVEFARSQKAVKKLEKILAQLLRLHPTKGELWIYAASYVLEAEADVTKARAYMQRGLRFCQKQKEVWLAYARLEMIYITKICMRRKILGLDGEKKEEGTKEEEDEDGEEILRLGKGVAMEDVVPATSDKADDTLDQVALQNLANTPAMTGAIPIAIFDAAMKEFDGDAELAERFFDVVAEYPQATCCARILQHILDHLMATSLDSVSRVICSARWTLFGVSTLSPVFPSKLSAVLSHVNSHVKDHPKMGGPLATKAIRLLLPYAVEDDMDGDISTAVRASIAQYIALVRADASPNRKRPEDLLAGVVEDRRKIKATSEANYLRDVCAVKFPSDDRFSSSLAVKAIEE